MILARYFYGMNQKIAGKLLLKFQLIPMLCFQILHDYACSIAPTGYCVELNIVDETFCENCSHFVHSEKIHSFGEICFTENVQKMLKIHHF